MKPRFSILPAVIAFLMLAVVSTGCDSEEEADDLALLIGTWSLTGAADEEGDKTAVFAALGTLDLDLDDDGTHTLTVDLVDPEEEDIALEGSYTVNDAARQLLLAITFSGVPFNLTFDYAFEDDDTVVLTASSVVIAALLGEAAGSLLEGDVTLTIERAAR